MKYLVRVTVREEQRNERREEQRVGCYSDRLLFGSTTIRIDSSLDRPNAPLKGNDRIHGIVSITRF